MTKYHPSHLINALYSKMKVFLNAAFKNHNVRTEISVDQRICFQSENNQSCVLHFH